MQISRKAEYAIFIMSHLAAEDEQPLPVKEIASRQGMPENLMPQLSVVLSKQGWIQGKRGAGGGLSLVVDPAKISVRDVIEAVEGPIRVTECILDKDCCSNQDDCPLHQVWQKAQSELVNVFENVTIKELSDRIRSKL